MSEQHDSSTQSPAFGPPPEPSPSTPRECPQEYITQVKQLLENLYDFPFFQRLDIAQQVDPTKNIAGESDAKHLRQLLLNAIETLNPGAKVPFRSPQARPYQLLQLHYVEGRTVHEAAHELGISERQAYRDLRRAEESVSAILWRERAQAEASSAQAQARQLSTVAMEVNLLDATRVATDIGTLLQRAQRAVEQLARQYGRQIHLDLPSTPQVLTVDPMAAQQVLTATLSYVVRQAVGNLVQVTLEPTAQIEIRFETKLIEPAAAAHMLTTIPLLVQLLDRLGWRYVVHPASEASVAGPTATYCLRLILHTPGATVLIIDDNQGLVDLLERYLTGHNYRVAAATSGRAGLALAETLQPTVILLDVMLPEMDGWEVLQTLRNRAQTRTTPIIICSVFDDPELAYSLGASLFLSKPITRDRVLAALRKLHITP